MGTGGSYNNDGNTITNALQSSNGMIYLIVPTTNSVQQFFRLESQ